MIISRSSLLTYGWGSNLRAWMTGLLGDPYTINQASYDLARLRHNGLINRTPHRNLYTLTEAGLAFAIFYTKVHDRLLRPLMPSTNPKHPHRRSLTKHRPPARQRLTTHCGITTPPPARTPKTQHKNSRPPSNF
ncbi:MAG: hypothetical protein ACRDRA_09465 [Pseudonocardiaceae bacterium]